MYELPTLKINVIIRRNEMNTIFSNAIEAPIMETQFLNVRGSFIRLVLVYNNPKVSQEILFEFNLPLKVDKIPVPGSIAF